MILEGEEKLAKRRVFCTYWSKWCWEIVYGEGDDHIVKTKSGGCSRPSLDNVSLSRAERIFDIE